MSQKAANPYPDLFEQSGVYDRLWMRGQVSLEELRKLFEVYATAPDGSSFASPGMTMVLQRTFCLFSPVMYALAREFAKAQGLLPLFKEFVPRPITSPTEAEEVLRSQPDWQAVLILGVLLDGVHGYPAARGWMCAATGHMLCGDVTILEILVRYLRDCNREGVQYFIGPSEASAIVAAELKQLIASSPDEHRDLEYEILRVLSARAPVEFLLRGHTLSRRGRMLEHLYEQCVGSVGSLWTEPEQMRILVNAQWLLRSQRDKLRAVWSERLRQ